MKITDTIKQLNSDLNNVANCEKAKKLRKNLLIGGGIAVGGGILLMIISMILFMSNAFSASMSGFPALTAIGMVLFLISGFSISAGAVAVKLGLSIIIAGVSSKYIDKTFTKKCECGSVIKQEELFCSNCGKSVRPVCPQCKAEQEVDAKFCRKCGTKLGD